MPIFPLPTDRDSHGFTLIELLVVLSLIGLLATIAMPSLARNPSALARSRLMAQVETSVERAADQARSTDQPVSVDLAALSGKLAFTPQLGSSSVPLFYPDGSSNGGTVSSDGRTILSISWFDGHITNADR